MADIIIQRVTIPDQVTSFQIPAIKRNSSYKKFIIRNTGTQNSIRFNFDNSQTHYVTLAPGEKTDVLSGLTGGEIIYTDGVNGTSTAELIIWED